MINFKSVIAQALKDIVGVKNVCQEYPDDFSHMPTITYKENDNSDAGSTVTEVISCLEYQVDIWKRGSTYSLEEQVDKKMSDIGLRRIMSNEITDPGTGLKHRVMRYKGKYNALDGRIYQ